MPDTNDIGMDIFAHGSEQNIRGGEFKGLKLDEAANDTFTALSCKTNDKCDLPKRLSKTSKLQEICCEPDDNCDAPRSHGICEPITADTLDECEVYTSEGEPMSCKMSL